MGEHQSSPLPTGSQLYPTRTTQPSSNSISQTSTSPSPNTHLTEP